MASAPQRSAPDASRFGQWSELFAMPNVAVHTHLLPDGNVLFWGRRDRPDGTMDQHECTPQIWDRSDTRTGHPVFHPTAQPLDADGGKINLFCSGHAHLPDGSIFVAGGRITDGHGLQQACRYG